MIKEIFYFLHFNKTLFNDPIYGFISIESKLILELINHKFFQRLRRISQMGLSNLVYPGAHHTRFEHALGSLHLMQKVIYTLKQKGVLISKDENEAMQIAILLHDIGHGPFSHATENILLKEINHEIISLNIIKLLNEEMKGKLSLAIEIFTNKYKRKFMYQLVSGQIDVDRLDYLKRDSFYTGVAEGNINVERIITMMNVESDKLVFESKALHSLEKFLLARRLMYWQVYLHKTSLAAELILEKLFQRYRDLINKGYNDESTPKIKTLISLNLSNQKIPNEILNHYLEIEDYEVFFLIKNWQKNDDDVLRNLSNQLIKRRLPKIKIQDHPFTKNQIDTQLQSLKKNSNVENQNFYVFTGSISNQTYRSDNSQIFLKDKVGVVKPINKLIDYLDFKEFSEPIFRYYLCYPKDIYSL